MSRYIPKSIKDAVAKRANYCCEYCISQLAYSPTNFSIEHIIPITKGGTNVLSNLAFSCQHCNNKKYIKTTATDEQGRLLHCIVLEQMNGINIFNGIKTRHY